MLGRCALGANLSRRPAATDRQRTKLYIMHAQQETATLTGALLPLDLPSPSLRYAKGGKPLEKVPSLTLAKRP
jgi:hypothetical protein